MDSNDFDNLTRRLASGFSRRGFAKGVLGGLLGGLAGLRVAETRAARAALGATCTRAAECASFHCVDGVCCNERCSGQCEACNLAGSVGVCTPLPAGTRQHGHRPACTGTGICQSSCDGVTRNQCTSYPDLDVVCGDPVCEASWQTTFGCGGDGTCHPTTTSCGLLLCNESGTACLTSCDVDAECVGAAYCADGVCQGDQPTGQPCATPDQCQSGLCIDGVCCASACDDPCRACNVVGHLGFCAPVADGTDCDDGNACTELDVCRNGHCQGIPVACARLDQCHDAVCDPATGQCVDTNVPDDTNCGDGRVCCAGICCAAGEECVAGVCQPGSCLGLDQFCDPANNQCCQDQPTFCEATSTCHAANPGSDPTCCHRTGSFCNDTCDCCDFQLCRDSTCCRIDDAQCASDDQCCSGVCCGGVCCGDFSTCCNGVCCATLPPFDDVCCDGVCQAASEPCGGGGTVPMGESCAETAECVPGLGLICANGGEEEPGEACGDTCCSPTIGAACGAGAGQGECRCCGAVECQCPGNRECTPENRVCGGIFSPCSADDQCVSDRCDDVTRSCCNRLGGFCEDGTHSMCCGTINCGCGPDVFCGAGSVGVCGGIGAPCTSGLQCVSGTCTPSGTSADGTCA